VLPDGKMVMGGFWPDFKGTAQVGVARLNRDGRFDAAVVHDLRFHPQLPIRIISFAQAGGLVFLQAAGLPNLV
jgi:hypothetical protein